MIRGQLVTRLMTQAASLTACCAAWIGLFGVIGRAVVLSIALWPPATVAAPIELKLSFFSSAQSGTFRSGVKPFVDAVNAEGKGLLAIKVYAGGVLSKTEAGQPKLLAEGDADIAWVVPGQTPYRFPDNQVLELAGLFRSAREGTLVYTRLIAAKAMRGYEDFFVIGAYTSSPGILHSREPIASLAALKGQKIRANNEVVAEAVKRLGAIPTVLSVSQLADALMHDTINGVVMGLAGPSRFGALHAAPNHYFLEIGVVPLVLVMARKKFDSLPAAAQALIRKYSGVRAAEHWIESLNADERRLLAKIKSDPAQKIFKPSSADRATARRAYESLMKSWAAQSPRHRELLQLVKSELAKVSRPN